MNGSVEKTRLRRLSSTAKLVAALGVALSVGFVAAVYAADPRLEQADGALEKAEALVLASQTGGGVPPWVQQAFDRRRQRAVDLINRARAQVAAAQDVVDQATGADSSAASAAASRPHVKPIAMRGGGWVARTRAHVRALLPCPGEDGGFNPQPDPPAGLAIRVGRDRYVLDEITTSSCAIGEGAARRGGIHQGSGLASCGGERGYIIDWRLTDGGVDPNNPNIPTDTAEVGIDGPGETAACTNNLHIGGSVRGNLVMRRARTSQAR
jgi:hypothetical protein